LKNSLLLPHISLVNHENRVALYQIQHQRQADTVGQGRGWKEELGDPYQLENGQTLPLRNETVLADKSITWRTVLVIKYDFLAQKTLYMGDFGNGLSVKYGNKHVHISHEARLA
jgi:hypothetical protein